MSTKSDLLRLLDENSPAYLSGQEIADTLGVSRNAIWKAVKSLQAQGHPIESGAGVGYRLLKRADILSSDLIREKILHPYKVQVFETLPSTNTYAKSIDSLDVPHLILAEHQTAGRGRLGRDFYSPAGKGIYLSLVFRPEFELSQAMLTTTMAAVAVCRALEDTTGLSPKIKWVNDIYLKGKKVCGILTEAESNFETGRIQKIVIGIGINCFDDPDMPADLQDIATHLEDPVKAFDRTTLIAAIANQLFEHLDHFNQGQLIRDYRARSFILGQPILIFNPAIARACGRPEGRLHEGIRARAIDIDENGGLVIEYMEGRLSRTMTTLTTGEITVRKAY